MSGVVGLDLSLTSSGIAGIEPHTLGFSSVQSRITMLKTVKSTGKKGDGLAARQRRLYGAGNEIVDLVTLFNPDLVVIEAPSYGSKFGSPHDRSGLWWIVVNALGYAGFPVAEVSPQGRAKYGTGKGNAKKDVVEAFVRESYQEIAPRRIANNDEADAILLAAMGARYLGYPVELRGLPVAAADALGGVSWPTHE